MNLEDRNNETVDSSEDYEMIPFEPMMYGYGQTNTIPNMDTNERMGIPMDYIPDFNTNMEMNPWMGMSQSNEDMVRNDYVESNDDSKQIDKYGDRVDPNGGYNNPNELNPKFNDIDSIVKRTEKFNPAIFRLLTRTGMPYSEARDIVGRVVRLTLMYSEE